MGQSEGLQRDLALWSSGLFPFFEYAATSVKVRVVLHLDAFTQNERLVVLTLFC